MKRVTNLLLLLCLVVLCLASCTSLNSYEDNLGKDYKVKIYEIEDDEDEIEDIAEDFDLDYEDYGIKAIIYAKDKDNSNSAYIIKCGSKEEAKDLKSDLKDYIHDEFRYDDDFDEIDVVIDGKFVLVGYEDVIDDALDK